MAQRKEEKPTVEQVLKLAAQLSPDEQDQLVDALELQWLQKALDEGEESARREGTIPADEVFRELRERNAEFKRRKNST